MNPSCELHIDALAAGGEGVARHADGRVVFVPYAVPGDRVQVSLVEQRKRYARGRIEVLSEASPDRVEPICPVFGRCGGCAWQHVRYGIQIEAKQRILRDAIERIGRLRLPDRFEFTPSPDPYRYRRRTRVVLRGERVFYRARRSHELVEIEGCPILLPSLEKAVFELARSRGRGEAARAGEPEGEEWEVACGDAGESVAAALSGAAREGGRTVVEVAGERVGFSAGTFIQAHAALTGELARAVARAAGSGRHALELHAGAGLFTLALARGFSRLVAIEADRRAALDLARNLREAGHAQVAVVEQKAEQALRESRTLGLSALDVAVLDPPRSGLSSELRRQLIALEPSRLVYVSCDPATLARDLADFAGSGWRLAALRGFDLFPQTPHLEALAVLERDTPQRSG